MVNTEQHRQGFTRRKGTRRRAVRLTLTLVIVLVSALPATRSTRSQETSHFTVLHTFAGSDGANSETGLIRDTAGNLYGTTIAGGDLNCNSGGGCGVVFKLDTTGKETVL